MKGRVLRALSDHGILIEPKAAEYLLASPDPMASVARLLAREDGRPMILTLEAVKALAEEPAPATIPGVSGTTVLSHPAPAAPPYRSKSEFRILKDVTGNSTCVGNVIDFAKLFNDRFTTLRKLLARRRELTGHVPIAKARRMGRDVRVIGIVNEVRVTKNGHRVLELEDEGDRINVLLLRDQPNLPPAVLTDEVVGVAGSLSRQGDAIIASEVVRPDVPMGNGMAPTDSHACVAFASDLHVGSKTFLTEQWERFRHWLGASREAEPVEYLVMPGDLVEGIGVYPEQEEDLLIEDLFEQYQVLAQLIREIPDRISVLLMPGNHDAVRLAEPQPTFPDTITKMFDSNVTFAGNPCWIELEGRLILCYHGRSMDDFVATIPGMTYAKPIEGMKEMLRRRHLAPIYGGRTPIAPEQKDYLVIDQVPQVFVTGHVHACAISEYRGVKLINDSAWQSQTAYQRMHNYSPDPARVPVLHLGTGEGWIQDFA